MISTKYLIQSCLQNPYFECLFGGAVGQISQTGNMTSTPGISRVLVTGDTSVGLSTLITEVNVSCV